MNIVTETLNMNAQPENVMHRYIAMCVNGLGTPIVVTFMSDQALDEKDTETIYTVEEFNRRSIDLDIHELHFIFRDAKTATVEE